MRKTLPKSTSSTPENTVTGTAETSPPAVDAAAVARAEQVPSENPRLFSVESAAQMARVPLSASSALRAAYQRRWIREGGSDIVRFVTDQMVVTPLHYRLSDGNGSNLTLRCNGSPCALCLAKNRPVLSCLLLTYFIDDGDLALLSFDRHGSAGALGAQLLPLLQRADFLNLVVEIAKQNQRYRVAIVRIRNPEVPSDDGMDFGDEVLRDLASRGGPKPEELVAAIEQRANQVLLADIEWLPRRIRLHHPEVDLAQL